MFLASFQASLIFASKAKAYKEIGALYKSNLRLAFKAGKEQCGSSLSGEEEKLITSSIDDSVLRLFFLITDAAETNILLFVPERFL